MDLMKNRAAVRELSLDELLSQLEIDLSRVGQHTPDSAVQMLLKMDRVFAILAEMQQRGNSIKADSAQFEYIVASLERSGRRFLRDLGGKETLEKLRQQVSPGAQQSWWWLDATVQNQARASLRRGLMTLGALAVGLVLLVVIYNRFFAPDPIVAKRYSLQLDADQYLIQGEFDKALDSINQALEIVPQDGGLVLMRGVLVDRMGKKSEAASEFKRAEDLINNREIFLLERTEAWIKVGAMQEGLADVQACIREFPESAQGYYYYGRLNELNQNYLQAIDAYNKASALAEKQGKTELNATIRMTMAMLMQSIPAVQPTLSVTPTK